MDRSKPLDAAAAKADHAPACKLVAEMHSAAVAPNCPKLVGWACDCPTEAKR